MKQILLFLKFPRPKDTEVETPQMSLQHTAGVTKTGLWRIPSHFAGALKPPPHRLLAVPYQRCLRLQACG